MQSQTRLDEPHSATSYCARCGAARANRTPRDSRRGGVPACQCRSRGPGDRRSTFRDQFAFELGERELDVEGQPPQAVRDPSRWQREAAGVLPRWTFWCGSRTGSPCPARAAPRPPARACRYRFSFAPPFSAAHPKKTKPFHLVPVTSRAIALRSARAPPHGHNTRSRCAWRSWSSNEWPDSLNLSTAPVGLVNTVASAPAGVAIPTSVFATAYPCRTRPPARCRRSSPRNPHCRSPENGRSSRSQASRARSG